MFGINFEPTWSNLGYDCKHMGGLGANLGSVGVNLKPKPLKNQTSEPCLVQLELYMYFVVVLVLYCFYVKQHGEINMYYVCMV